MRLFISGGLFEFARITRLLNERLLHSPRVTDNIIKIITAERYVNVLQNSYKCSSKHGSSNVRHSPLRLILGT